MTAPKTWPASKIYKRRLTDLKPFDRNSRTHTDDQIEQIARSITEWGWTVPILVDEDNVIIAGHARFLAAQRLDLDQVPVMVAKGWTDAQRRAYVIADNKLAENAGWDFNILQDEIGALDGLDFDLDLLGFDAAEIGDLLDQGGMTDPDDVPETPVDPVSVECDVWILGKHRLACGDSTSADVIERLMDGQKADLCFTSPPYAQQREYKKEISDWDGLMNGVFSIMPVKDGAQVLVNLGLVHDAGRVNTYWAAWLDFMAANGWPLFGWYVWDQGFGMPGNWNGRLAPSHEFVFHFARKPSQSNKWQNKKPENIKATTSKKGAFRQKDGTLNPIKSGAACANPTKVADSVIRVNRAPIETAKMGHPATYPVALCEYIYRSYTKAGDWVFEPFSGSGTSIIACEGMGLRCAAVELAPHYVDVAIKRWQDFTGLEAVRESDGMTFGSAQE